MIETHSLMHATSSTLPGHGGLAFRVRNVHSESPRLIVIRYTTPYARNSFLELRTE
jgi:hypothetical protein